MSGRAFFDSNILIYAFGPFHAEKSRLARDMFMDAGSSHMGVVSYQVVQEFLNIALRKFQPPTSKAMAKEYIRELAFSMEVLPWSLELMTAGLSIKERYRFSWCDSLIVSAALQSGCETLYTEDLQHSQRVETLTIVNPFL